MNLYSKGDGVNQDNELAVEWYRKGAEAGYDDAMAYLGCAYLKGIGVDQDNELAVEWYRKSAEAGGDHAKDLLANAYRKGSSTA